MKERSGPADPESGPPSYSPSHLCPSAQPQNTAATVSWYDIQDPPSGPSAFSHLPAPTHPALSPGHI